MRNFEAIKEAQKDMPFFQMDSFEMAELADFIAGEISDEDRIDNRELPALEEWEKDLEPF